MTTPLSPEAVAQMVADLMHTDGPDDEMSMLYRGVIADALTTLSDENATLRHDLAETEALEMQHGAVIERLMDENATLRHDRDVAVVNNDVLRIAMDTLRAERDDLKSAMTPTPDAELDAFVDFMCGAGEFDGAWFGDAHHSLSGHFWWRTRLRQTIATLRASEAAALERAEKAEAVAAKLLAADKLREAYHAKPNDHNRIGDRKSPKHLAKTHWLRAFNRAVASARALTHTADKE